MLQAKFIYFLKHKSDVIDYFRKFVTLFNNKYDRKVKTLRYDNGKKYCIYYSMTKFLEKRGIQLETAYTPEQNGRSERENRTIVECARTMMKAKSVQKQL